MICDCSYQNRKRLIISFGLNQSMEDFLIHFETVEGYYHRGLYERAKRIPIKYFIQKVIYENYDLILTGDSLGASIAGIVTANFLTHKAMSNQKDKRNQVLFVGFGSPAFGSRDFKKFVDNDKMKNNFYFYFNELDNSVNILDNLLNYFIKNENSSIDQTIVNDSFDILKHVLGFGDFSEKKLECLNDRLKGILMRLK